MIMLVNKNTNHMNGSVCAHKNRGAVVSAVPHYLNGMLNYPLGQD